MGGRCPAPDDDGGDGRRMAKTPKRWDEDQERGGVVKADGTDSARASIRASMLLCCSGGLWFSRGASPNLRGLPERVEGPNRRHPGICGPIMLPARHSLAYLGIWISIHTPGHISGWDSHIPDMDNIQKADKIRTINYDIRPKHISPSKSNSTTKSP